MFRLKFSLISKVIIKVRPRVSCYEITVWWFGLGFRVRVKVWGLIFRIWS